MIRDTAVQIPPAGGPPPALVQRISESAPNVHLRVLGRLTPIRQSRAARLGRSLREQFQATTGIGLSPPLGNGAPPRRLQSARRDGMPGLSFLDAGDPEGRKVVFVHGTPGNATDWMPFLDASPAGQRRLAIDRPGFGQSGPSHPVVSLSEQANWIAEVLDGLGGAAVVVGSSYGGPVALRLAANHPDKVAGLLLVGGAANPTNERIHPAQRVASIRAFGALLPRALAHANAELLALRNELEELAGVLDRIVAPVTLLHGLDDTLVPAENVAYLGERLTGAVRLQAVLVDGSGHFLHILASDLVEEALSVLVETATPPR